MRDKSSDLTHKTAEILEIQKKISEKLEPYLVTETERPDISYELLKMLVIADEILEAANPSKTTGEIFGLPKEAVYGSKSAYEFSNEESWDFRPWFIEKASNVKNGILITYKYWEMKPSQVKLKENAPMSSAEWIKDGIYGGLNMVKAYAETIFKMIRNDKITVISDEGDQR